MPTLKPHVILYGFIIAFLQIGQMHFASVYVYWMGYPDRVLGTIHEHFQLHSVAVTALNETL